MAFPQKSNWAILQTFYGVSGCPGWVAPAFFNPKDVNNRGELGSAFQRLMLNDTKDFVKKMVKQSAALSDFDKKKIDQFVRAQGLDLSKIMDSSGNIQTEGMVILLTHLGILLSKDQMDTMAKGIVQAMKNTLDSKLFSTTGFSNFQTFRNNLRNEAKLSSLFQYMDKKKFKVAMRTPSAVRPLLMTNNSYFKNQFQTGSSKGALNPDARFQLEAGRLHIPYEEYDRISITVRPKYGSLMAKEQLVGDTSSIQYGDDLWILNADKIEDCTTWTVGDSLDAAYMFLGQIPKHWYYTFVPLDYVDLSVPFLIPPKPLTAEPRFLIYKNANPLTKMIVSGLNGMSDVPELPKTSKYLEVQIWCKINMSDVEALIYLQTPTTAKENQFLKSKGIELFSGTNKTMKKIPL